MSLIFAVMGFLFWRLADRLPARRRHRRSVHAWSPDRPARPCPRTDRALDDARDYFMKNEKRQRRGRVHRRRLLLRRPGPECRHRLRPAEAVGRAQGQGEYVQGDRRPRDRRTVAISRRADRLFHPARRARARQRDRLRSPAGRHRQYRSRQAGRGAQHDARHGDAGQTRRRRPASQPRGCAPAQRRRRPGQGARARARYRPDQPDDLVAPGAAPTSTTSSTAAG